MVVNSLGYKSKRKMTLEQYIEGGTIVRVNGNLYIIPIEDEIAFDWDGYNANSDDYIALVNLKNGNLELVSVTTPCEIIKNAQLNYFEDEVESWVI